MESRTGFYDCDCEGNCLGQETLGESVKWNASDHGQSPSTYALVSLRPAVSPFERTLLRCFESSIFLFNVNIRFKFCSFEILNSLVRIFVSNLKKNFGNLLDSLSGVKSQQ